MAPGGINGDVDRRRPVNQPLFIQVMRHPYPTRSPNFVVSVQRPSSSSTTSTVSLSTIRLAGERILSEIKAPPSGQKLNGHLKVQSTIPHPKSLRHTMEAMLYLISESSRSGKTMIANRFRMLRTASASDQNNYRANDVVPVQLGIPGIGSESFLYNLAVAFSDKLRVRARLD